LELVHVHFTPLILALSAVQAASVAEEISLGSMTFESVYPVFALVLVVGAVLFIGPLFIFSAKLWTCRVKGLSDYMGLAARYVGGFDRKWLGAGAPAEQDLLGTPDLQSLADLANSVAIVRNMRWIPVSPQLLAGFAIAALVPMLPLLLFEYPVAALAEKFMRTLTGL
jgi:hypothetical protein